jgi:NADPH:quinone reductase-like Zn-dependent oxidoreductase
MRRLGLPLWLRLPLRLYVGLRRPRRLLTLGQELAGVVESVGAGVTRFAPGDAVVAGTGFSLGGNADYCCVREGGMIAKLPPAVPFEQAAALPVGGIEALSLLRAGGVKEGDRVLVYGASGSIGSFAVQLAAHLGARVTAVTSPAAMELAADLGAAEAIDYTTADFTRPAGPFDVIADAIGKSPFSWCARSLAPGGRYVQANPRTGDRVRRLFVRREAGTRVMVSRASEDPAALAYLVELAAAGQLCTIIDRRYPLEAIADAHRYVDTGEKTGNVIITFGEPSQA